MIREGNSSTDPYTKFKSAGKLAKTVAHWKTKGIDVAVSRNMIYLFTKDVFKICERKTLISFPPTSFINVLRGFTSFDRQIPRESSTMRGSRTKERWYKWFYFTFNIQLCFILAREDYRPPEHREVITLKVQNPHNPCLCSQPGPWCPAPAAPEARWRRPLRPRVRWCWALIGQYWSRDLNTNLLLVSLHGR